MLTPGIAMGNMSHNTRHLRLNIGEQTVNFTGRKRTATTINNSLPAPTLRWKEGDVVTIDVHNQLKVPSSIHWHGIILPSNMDGVPGLSFDGIAPGASFRYQFRLNQSGTYWYHSHSGFQEQTGLYGAIVVDPTGHHAGMQHHVDRDHAIVLSDWSDESPERILSNLRKNSHFYNRNRRALSDIIRDIRTEGVTETLQQRQMWNTMRMSDSDISDVTGFTYTFLMNGMTPATGWQGLFRPHEKIRLRFINASAMTFFDLRIPGLKMKVIASDGQNIHPVSVDDIRLGAAETVDVIVEPHHQAPYAIFAQAIDRSG
ncbi:MAG: copper resistance system multicopper oxidase, partial [Pseudomonadota bacterium]